MIWLALLATALLVKLLALAALHDHPLLRPRGDLDTAYYVQQATRLAAGDWNLGGEPFFVSPLYIFVLGAIFRVAGVSLLAAQVVQVIGGVAAVGLIAWTARQWYGARAGWIAGGLAIATGLFTFNEIVVLQSAIDPLLTSLWLAALTRALRGGEARWWLLTGAAFGLHGLNRPNVLLCLVVLAAALVWLWRWRAGVTRAALVASGVALVLAPMVARNLVSIGEPLIVSAHGGLNFYIGNHPGADGTYSNVPGITPSIRGQVRDARLVAEAARGRGRLSEGEISSYFYEQATDWIAAHPATAAGLFLKKLAYTFNAIDLALNYSYSYFARDERSILSWLIVGPWLLIPLGMTGLIAIRPRDDWRTFLPWALMTPAYALGVALFFVSGRYRLPLLLPLVITSAGLVSALIDWRRGQPTPQDARSDASSSSAASVSASSSSASGSGSSPSSSSARPRVATIAAGLLAFGLLANWPVALDDGRADARTERVVLHIEAGEDADAARLLEAATPRHPEPGLLHYRAARAWHARGELDRAAAAYRRALTFDPDQPEIHFNLGELLTAREAWGEAIPHLDRACAAHVRLPRCTALLAHALASSGQPQRAVERLRALQAPAPEVAEALAGTTPAEWALLGSLALDLRQPDLASAWLEASLARDPDRSAVQEQYGLALMLLDRPRPAIAAFERASALDPASASAAYNLAVAHLAVNDTAGARRWVDEALRRDPAYEAARRLRAAVP